MHPLRPSSATRAGLCPASCWREAELPNPDSPYAAEGRRLHSVIAEAIKDGHEWAPENEADAEIVGQCLKFLDKRIEALRETIPAEYLEEANLVVRVEQHLGIPWMDQGGTADVIAYWAIGNRIVSDILVLDWKTGRALNDCPAERDVQMLAYSVGARAWLFNEEMCGTASVSVQAYRYHPRLAYVDRMASCTFGGSLQAWIDCIEILLTIRRAVDQLSPPAVAGHPQCDFCRARLGHCAEFDEWVESGVATTLARIEYEETGLIRPEEIVRILAFDPALKAANSRMKAIKAEAVKRIEAGEEFFTEDGKVLALKEGKPVRSVDNIETMAELLGMPKEAVYECCTMGVGKLDDWYLADQRAMGPCTEKEARKRLKDAAGSVLEVTHNRPSIVAVAPTTSTCG